MAGIDIKWTGGRQFLATDGAGRTVVTDSEGQGFKPPELMLVSLVGCAGVDVTRILEKKRQKFTHIDVKVDKTHDADPPWCIEKIEVEWTVRGKGLKEKAVKDAVRLSERGYCSVAASLTSEIITTVRIINEDEGDA